MIKSSKTVYDLIIVGAGAAGLFAGAETDSRVKTLILEKKAHPGIKLLMTGSGQCNLTHEGNIKDFVKKYNNPSFVRPILYAFTNEHLVKWFAEKGLTCSTREDGKIFPTSMKAQDVRAVLLDEIRRKGHELQTHAEVQSIKWDETRQRFTLKTDACRYSCTKLVLAGGGKSYPKTGSDGQLFEVIKCMGIQVTALKPALTTVKVYDYPYSSLTGLTLKQVSLKIIKREGKLMTSKGDLLLTPTGLSGPVILNNTRSMDPDDTITIDFLSDVPMHTLEAQLTTNLRQNTKKSIKNVCCETINLPHRLIEQLLTGSDIDLETKASEMPIKSLRRLIQKIKSHPFVIRELGEFDKAMVTSGGVCTDDLCTQDLSHKSNPNLYFIGEMLDIDGETGGYNLQFAFSSAHKCIFSFIIDESKKMC